MPILIATISIFVITGIVWLFNKISPLKVCPICAGVSGTWILILVGLFFGWLLGGSWLIIAVMGMGGSVVGIAYQVSKRLPPNRSPLLWQTLFIPAGFIAVYSIIHFEWIILAFALAFMIGLTFVFLKKIKKVSSEENEIIDKLEKKMEDCC